VLQVISSGSVQDASTVLPVRSLGALRYSSGLSDREYFTAVSTTLQLGAFCNDTLFSKIPSHVVASLRRMVGDSTVSSCELVLPFCGNLSLVRMLCPWTCGCGTPRSGLLRAGEDAGCNPACESSDMYRNALAKIPCEDANLEELQAQGVLASAWKRLTDAYRQSEMFNQAPGWITFTPDQLHRQGCEVVDSLQNPRVLAALCGGALGMRGIADFCPRACNCADPRFTSLKCPPSCKAESAAAATGAGT